MISTRKADVPRAATLGASLSKVLEGLKVKEVNEPKSSKGGIGNKQAKMARKANLSDKVMKKAVTRNDV